MPVKNTIDQHKFLFVTTILCLFQPAILLLENLLRYRLIGGVQSSLLPPLRGDGTTINTGTTI
jgi:hypothetical protein